MYSDFLNLIIVIDDEYNDRMEIEPLMQPSITMKIPKGRSYAIEIKRR